MCVCLQSGAALGVDVVAATRERVEMQVRSELFRIVPIGPNWSELSRIVPNCPELSRIVPNCSELCRVVVKARARGVAGAPRAAAGGQRAAAGAGGRRTPALLARQGGRRRWCVCSLRRKGSWLGRKGSWLGRKGSWLGRKGSWLGRKGSWLGRGAGHLRASGIVTKRHRCTPNLNWRARPGAV
jgi:hypothetical protein